MKAKVKETGEIVEVKSLYSVTYSRLDCNGKIIEEFDEDELEFIPNPNIPKMVSLDKACEWLRNNFHNYANNALGKEYLVNDFKSYMMQRGE